MNFNQIFVQVATSRQAFQTWRQEYMEFSLRRLIPSTYERCNRYCPSLKTKDENVCIYLQVPQKTEGDPSSSMSLLNNLLKFTIEVIIITWDHARARKLSPNDQNKEIKLRFEPKRFIEPQSLSFSSYASQVKPNIHISLKKKRPKTAKIH
jgi:hypothetical protein